MPRESGDTSGDTPSEDIDKDDKDGTHEETNIGGCTQQAADSGPKINQKDPQNAEETFEDVEETLRLAAHLVETDHAISEGTAPIEKSSAIIPITITEVKNNLPLDGLDSTVHEEVDANHAHSSHIEIRIQEDDASSQGTNNHQASVTEGIDSSILNLEVSCPMDVTSKNGDPNAATDPAKVFAVLYSCNKCSFCTSKMSKLKLHAQKEKHDNDEEEPDGTEDECDVTGENVLIDYACSNCSFKTKRFLTYREHLLTHTKIGAKEMFKCLDCDYTTRHKYNLKTHLKRHAKIGELCEDEVFRCGKCDYISPYKHDLMTHMKKHDPEKPFQCDQCDFQSIYKHSLIHHVRSKHEKLRPFKCEQCTYCSARKQDLQTHMGRHAEEKKFKCDRCLYATPYKVSFKAHMDRHMGNKLFKCEHEGCDFATTTKQNLKSHELRHSSVKPLKCALCDYTAAHRQQIINHELKHGVTDSPTKTYRCTSCDYTTAHRYCLQRHMKRHKADRKMPEKDYVCSECGYSTGYKNSLKRHMAKHSDVKPFKCGHCEYSAINMTQMHVHIAKHTGIKPFKCDVCDYATANKQHLVGHMAKHSEVRLRCTQCNFSTAWKQRLRAHLKAHETGQLHQKKQQNDASAQTGKILHTVPDAGKDRCDHAGSDKDQALNEISSAIEAFQTHHLHGGIEVSSSDSSTPMQVHENGTTADAIKAASFEQVGEVQLIDEDGNKMSAAVQCVNGKQTIEILVGNGIKQTVALKDLQKDSQVFVWEQTEEADGTRHIRAVSPSKSNPSLRARCRYSSSMR